MGLIKALKGAGGSVMGDQWKEFFYCDALGPDILMTKGRKVVSSRSSNTNGSDNIITSGSGIAVADGQCMIILEQGKVVEVCAEPGEFIYNSSTEPSVFSGNLGDSIIETFKSVGKRFTYGGDTGKDQRVYYINTKHIYDNKFGTPNPIPFRVVDSKINLDIDVSLRCSGVYAFRIANPLLFYTNVCGNVEDEFRRSKIEGQLKNEFIAALQPAMAKLSAKEIRPNQIIAENKALGEAMKEELTAEWSELRGIEVITVSLSSVTLKDEDTELIKQAQRTAMFKDANMAGATLVEAQAEAMKTAAGNKAGAMTGFMGMGMAMNSSNGINAQSLYALGQEQEAKKAAEREAAKKAGEWKCACGAVSTGNFCTECGAKKPEEKKEEGEWVCSCGATATGKFCQECGAKKPEQAQGWTCSCGAVNKGRFCPECGAKKPVSEPLYKCDKCGWEPEDPKNPPKFCPECGDIFNDGDITN